METTYLCVVDQRRVPPHRYQSNLRVERAKCAGFRAPAGHRTHRGHGGSAGGLSPHRVCAGGGACASHPGLWDRMCSAFASIQLN